VIASSDYIKAQPDQLAPWLGSRLHSLGTDGFGAAIIASTCEFLRDFSGGHRAGDAFSLAGTGAISRNGRKLLSRRWASIRTSVTPPGLRAKLGTP